MPKQEQSNVEGRLLLKEAIELIPSGRWEELTSLLQSHAPQLQAARLRLEQQALELHSTRARSQNDKQDANPVRQMGTPIVRTVAAAAAWADRFPWLALLVIQAVILATYAQGFLYRGFIMDDAVGMMRNPNVIGETLSFADLMRRDFWGLPMHGSGWTNKSFRPLTTLTFRWNYLLHGLDSSGFHATNILLHCLTSLILGRTATVALGMSGSWAALASALFGVHPVHTENVLYLVCRADILACLLGLLAMNCYAASFSPPAALRPLWPTLRSRPFDAAVAAVGSGILQNPLWMIFPVLLIIASGLCKESGFTLFSIPMLMELLDFLSMQAWVQHQKERFAKRTFRRFRLRAGLLVASTFLVFVARYRHTGGTSLNMSPQDNPISFETERKARILSYSYVHGVYMRLLVWPQFLCYDYSMDAIPMVRDVFDCRLMLPLSAYVGCMASVSFVMQLPARHRRSGLIALALLVVSFLPASNILFPVGTVVGERLMYVPSAGYCLAVVVVLHAFLQGTLHKPRAPPRPEPTKIQRGKEIHSWGIGSGRPEAMRRGFKVTLCVTLALTALSVRTWLRVWDWESSDTLFIRDGARQPQSSKTQFNLGITHMQMQEWDAAVDALVRCAWADPLSSLPFYRIGQIEILRNRFDSAVFHDLALAMFQNGKVDQAETRLRISLQLNPDFAKGWNNLACCLASKMNLNDSARALRKAVSLDPENPQYWANLAVLSQHLGDYATSKSAMSTALQIWPSMPEHRDCAWEFAPAG
ncbi:unnamed protein product [Durusdinium trenchii]|uniref:dolichyl-phosphate-mannose--protein mannosyltransferase n=1 Tax=Durusdinium trenchii TaxID=1381693 RepID=A0ABP0T0D9_9DINO